MKGYVRVPGEGEKLSTVLDDEGTGLLTEAEVQRSFRRLFSGSDVSPGAFEKAETLIENLRPESPLRHRLTSELEELRRLCGVES